MQIVIDIPDEVYRGVCWRGLTLCPNDEVNLVKAIRTGIPLQKGHGRLIDADELQAEMDKDVRRAMSFVDLKDFVWLAPTIIKAD